MHREVDPGQSIFVCGSKRANSFTRLRIQVSLAGLGRGFVKVPARPLRGYSCGLLMPELVDDAVGVLACACSRLILLDRRS